MEDLDVFHRTLRLAGVVGDRRVGEVDLGRSGEFQRVYAGTAVDLEELADGQGI